MSTSRPRSTILVACAAALLISGCTPQLRSHGYLPSEEDLSFVTVGVDTRDSVIDTVGPPGTAGVLDGGNLYYVGDTVQTIGPRKPRIIEREIVAITFDEAGVVNNIVRYGLEDGKVVPLVKRVTESSDGDISFIRKLFGNIGGIDTGQFFGG